ncbi:electron transfer flavoprotein alpha subunit apoprotein [Desulfuromonas soudanensis]|uniref:Electron transfer flavoprotein alpha subunit apoprotein n=1 Tax=Desulfuromonas soudanensis TaxID=1603606 RepID=A0A0M4D012_9BACT|nr:electron transfer flavoprotein subunit alpha/FixB family protein [Desulfuromonas soudanensis]ALC15101.1 electron transfer flavoprotein alpha subunit apoprotein [Desulfuromonas soudanensis]
MKALLVAECRGGEFLESSYELAGFAAALGAESVMFCMGGDAPPAFAGTLYQADAAVCGEFNPALHKALLLQVIDREKPDLVVFCHSSYGWDLAPRLALALKAGQVSEVVALAEGGYVVPACNSKLRRTVRPSTALTVVTLQSGAFPPLKEEGAAPPIISLAPPATEGGMEFLGYEAAEIGEVDLSRAEVIVSAGRGIGKKENISLIADLARAMGGELGASRPVVDAGWAPHDRQVGSTGQAVSPKLYMACGISGAVQHLMGMKKSDFIVAINSDRDAPIGEVADVLVVADLKEFVPALIAQLQV